MKWQDNIGEFERDVQHFLTDLLPDDVIKAHKKIVLEALRSLVKLTPVDTGRARGNWFVSIGELEERIDEEKLDKSGSNTIREGLEALNDLKAYAGSHFGDSGELL